MKYMNYPLSDHYHLFLDLDETLIHTKTVYINDHFRIPREEISKKYEVFGQTIGIYYYKTWLRKNVRPFLEWCQSIYCPDHIHLLTSATREYAENILGHFKLNIGQIFDRKNISKFPYSKTYKLPFAGHFILVDNLSYEDHCLNGGRNKIGFLNNLPRRQYVQISNFYPPYDDNIDIEWEDEVTAFEDVKTKILRIVNNT